MCRGSKISSIRDHWESVESDGYATPRHRHGGTDGASLKGSFVDRPSATGGKPFELDAGPSLAGERPVSPEEAVAVDEEPVALDVEKPAARLGRADPGPDQGRVA